MNRTRSTSHPASWWFIRSARARHPTGPTGLITLRDNHHGGDVLAADGHSLTGASCMPAAWDVFVILKAGRPCVARHERALPLIIDLCLDCADNTG